MKKIALALALLAAVVPTAHAANAPGSANVSTALPTLANGSNSAPYLSPNGGLFSQPIFGNQMVDATHGLPVTPVCSNVPVVTPNSATAVNFLVINSGATKSFCDAHATVGGATTYLMLFDATTQQSGAVTYKAFGGTLIDCIGPVANGTLAMNYAANPISGFSTGILVETSSTGCLTATPTTNLIIEGRAQ